MSAEFCEEHRELQDLVARFVDRELMPLEPRIIEREIRGDHPTLTPEEAAPLLAKCRELGLWALDVPEEFGGVNLPAVALMAVNEELWCTVVPFTFPPDSPNLHMLMAVATPEQKTKYLEPYARGDAKSCLAVSEPGAGADPSGMTTKAEPVGNGWVVIGSRMTCDERGDSFTPFAAADPRHQDDEIRLWDAADPDLASIAAAPQRAPPASKEEPRVS